MKNVTITIWVEPSSVLPLMTTLKVLDGLDIENNYVFTPSDIKYSETFISNWITINIPFVDYSKFGYCYRKLGGK